MEGTTGNAGGVLFRGRVPVLVAFGVFIYTHWSICLTRRIGVVTFKNRLAHLCGLGVERTKGTHEALPAAEEPSSGVGNTKAGAYDEMPSSHLFVSFGTDTDL